MTEREEHHLGEDLLDVVEGRLEPARAAELERHIAGCPACQQAVSSARLVLSAIDTAAELAPSPGFDPAMAARLDAIDREARSRKASPGFLDRLAAVFTLEARWLRLGAIGAAAAAAAVIVVMRTGAGGDEEALSMTPELAQNLEGLDYAEDLELYQNLELIEDLDVIEDLELIEHLEEGEPG